MPNNNVEWGQGAVNQTSGWGSGASNNTNGWGEIHYDTLGHDETNLTGLSAAAQAYIARVIADGGVVEAKSYVNEAIKDNPDAEFLFIPSAYKAGKMFSVLPENGDGDLTFARNSPAFRTNSAGELEEMAVDVGRVDYSLGQDPSLLLEPQRVNLLTYSEEFNNAAWVKADATISVDSRGQRVTWDATSGLHVLSQTTTYQASSVYTQTYIIENDGVDFVQIYEAGIAFASVNDAFVNFDLTNMTLVNSGFDDASISEYGGKIKITATLTAGATGTGILALSGTPTMSSGFRPSYTPDGVSGLYISYSQLEEGSYPTSYIKTEASQATRIADDIDTTLGSPIANSAEGTFIIKLKGRPQSSGSSSPAIRLELDGSNYIGLTVSSVWRLRLQTTTNGAILNNSPVSVEDDVALGIKYSASGWAMAANGSIFASGNDDCSDITQLTDIVSSIAEDRGIFNIQEMAVFPTALADAEFESKASL